MGFIIDALIRLLAVIGVYQVGKWSISSSGSSSSTSSSSSPTLLGDAKLWAIAAMVVGGALVADQFLKDRAEGVL